MIRRISKLDRFIVNILAKLQIKTSWILNVINECVWVNSDHTTQLEPVERGRGRPKLVEKNYEKKRQVVGLTNVCFTNKYLYEWMNIYNNIKGWDRKGPQPFHMFYVFGTREGFIQITVRPRPPKFTCSWNFY